MRNELKDWWSNLNHWWKVVVAIGGYNFIAFPSTFLASSIMLDGTSRGVEYIDYVEGWIDKITILIVPAIVCLIGWKWWGGKRALVYYLMSIILFFPMMFITGLLWLLMLFTFL